MSVEYTLGRTPSGTCQQLACDEQSDAYIRALSVHGVDDCLDFQKRTGKRATYGGFWGLANLGCFTELRPYARLADMPEQDVEKLAVRVYELLFMGTEDEARHAVVPQVDVTDTRYQQILGELRTLEETERRLIESGEIIFPTVSDEEAIERLYEMCHSS